MSLYLCCGLWFGTSVWICRATHASQKFVFKAQWIEFVPLYTGNSIGLMIQLCEKCGEIIGTKKHLTWLYDKLGPIAYANPSLLLAKSDELLAKIEDIKQQSIPAELEQKGVPRPNDFIKILCPKCKFKLNVSL